MAVWVLSEPVVAPEETGREPHKRSEQNRVGRDVRRCAPTAVVAESRHDKRNSHWKHESHEQPHHSCDDRRRESEEDAFPKWLRLFPIHAGSVATQTGSAIEATGGPFTWSVRRVRLETPDALSRAGSRARRRGFPRAIESCAPDRRNRQGHFPRGTPRCLHFAFLLAGRVHSPEQSGPDTSPPRSRSRVP